MSVGLTAVIMEIDSYIAWIEGYMRKKGRSRSTAGESGTGMVPVPPENLPLEDMILKSAVTYFEEVLLPYLGIDCKITGIAPAEVLSELHERINTYRVMTVRLKDRDADQLFDQLKQKLQTGERIEREEVIPLLLTPLMSGKMAEKERFIEGNRQLQASGEITADEEAKVQAVLYALAVKFLDSKDLEEVKEEFSMTLLGQMLVNDGIEMGRSETLRELALEMRKNGEPYEKVARYTRTPVETIRMWEKENG